MRISDWRSDVCSSDLRVARIAPVDVADRHPVDIRMGAVDPPRELVERIADVLIGFDVAARGRRDLEQINARVPVRMLVEEALVTEEAFGEPLRIIEPVDADDPADRKGVR